MPVTCTDYRQCRSCGHVKVKDSTNYRRLGPGEWRQVCNVCWREIRAREGLAIRNRKDARKVRSLVASLRGQCTARKLCAAGLLPGWYAIRSPDFGVWWFHADGTQSIPPFQGGWADARDYLRRWWVPAAEAWLEVIDG